MLPFRKRNSHCSVRNRRKMLVFSFLRKRRNSDETAVRFVLYFFWGIIFCGKPSRQRRLRKKRDKNRNICYRANLKYLKIAYFPFLFVYKIERIFCFENKARKKCYFYPSSQVGADSRACLSTSADCTGSQEFTMNSADTNPVGAKPMFM